MTLGGTPLVTFRELIRDEIRKQLRVVDQVDLGEVHSITGSSAEVVLDSMSIPVPAIAAVEGLVAGDRVVAVCKIGGQQWMIVGKVVT